MTAAAASFVWVRGVRGPACEKWPAGMPAELKAHSQLLAGVKLKPDELALPLSTLAARYPAPAAIPEEA
jgi:hypothetical protein